MIATLQQQVNTMLLHQQGSRIEVARPQVFSGKMKEVSAFINVACLYIRIVTNFIWPYLHQFFDYSHGLKTSLKPLKRPFD